MKSILEKILNIIYLDLSTGTQPNADTLQQIRCIMEDALKNMNLIAIIPAKDNSKRLPNKNMLPCNGIPLVVRAIRIAKDSELFGDRIYVSSEDKRILDTADSLGVQPLDRDPILSGDNIQTASVVIDVLARIHYSCEFFCVLNPTSPLRTAEVLKGLYVLFSKSLVQMDCFMTGIKKHKFVWVHDGTAIFCKIKPFLAVLDFYKLKIKWINSVVCCLDINTADDFAQAEKILKEREAVGELGDWGLT